MKAAAAALAVAALAVAAASAQDWSDAKDEFANDPGYAASKALCRQVKGREPPAADRPDPATAWALKGCDSEALYYGIGMKADPVKARQCAFIEAQTADADAPFSGRTMLMTVYANGVGARRDLDVALHLACGIEGAPMEMDGRVRHVAAMKTKPERDFSYCDDITSGLAMGYCAAHEARIADAARDARIARLTASWSAADRAAFARLHKASDAYVDAHSSGEIDLSGTARGAIATEAEQKLKDEFVALLERLAAGRGAGNVAGYAPADAQLNAAYRKLLSATEPSESPGAVTRQGIRDAQRAWLAYRDAFLAFAAARFPSVPKDALAARLTELRTRLLREGGD